MKTKKIKICPLCKGRGYENREGGTVQGADQGMSGWVAPLDPDARQKYYKAYLARVVQDALREVGLEQDEVLRVVKEACDG